MSRSVLVLIIAFVFAPALIPRAAFANPSTPRQPAMSQMLAWPWIPSFPTAVPSPEATPIPVDDETLERLIILGFAPGEEPQVVPVIALAPPLQMQPGQTVAPALGTVECCYVFFPVPVSARWSISPSDGARVDATNGLLAIDPETPSGRVFVLRADVEHGRRIVEVEIHVFTPEANPLIGYRQELAELSCATGLEVAPEVPIAELIFNADGTFWVTWFPFEIYKDYWGTYTFDLERGTIDLVVEGGNYVPPDVDGQGNFFFDSSGRLILDGIWFGSTPEGTGGARCGHIFG